MTNGDGKYAWDVPEGWWRVKYEKTGYETTWSEWMTVPPLQTEVNVGLISTDANKYAIRLTDDSDTSAKLTLTNNTSSDVNVLYAVVAYNSDGRMIVCNIADVSLEKTKTADITISYSESDEVAVIKAFVLSADTLAPLRRAWVHPV